MDNNSIFMKLFNYSWLVMVLIIYVGGLGFIFAGWRVNETRWMDEGIIYMIPFILFSFTLFNEYIVYLAILLWIVGIIRAILIIKPYTIKLKEMELNSKGAKHDEMKENSDIINRVLNDEPDSEISKNAMQETDNYIEKRPPSPVPINTAPKDELTRIPHITPFMAEKIIELRNSGKHIVSPEDLYELNLNDVQIDELKDSVDFSTGNTSRYNRRLDI